MVSSTPIGKTEHRKPTLAICDDHLVVAQGIARALHNAYDTEAVFRSGFQLEELLLTRPPDLVVTEVKLLDQGGLDVLEHVRARGIRIPFVICTSQTDPVTLHRAFYAGARGVVTKAEGVKALESAIELALQGKVYLSGTFMQVLISQQQLPVVRLTVRQRAVLELIDEGLAAQQIADRLGLSKRTVESHKLKLLRMTESHSPQELLIRARRLGLLRPAGVRRLLQA
ncbi:response regulator [Dyella amyloliquefaciens]|uniref:response regulator n=1 Tax=Dyella amyloliquefaciens TaxID=1770545 RepID=UPI0013EEB9E2|nr:response regulator transcription factor [Dyella amyloliquefaciens]